MSALGQMKRTRILGFISLPMLRMRWISLATMLVTVIGSASASASGPEDSIAIAEHEQFIDITVPLSKLTIRLPKGDSKQDLPPARSGATENPRYFAFADEARGVKLSGWFEPASRFEGVKDSPPAVVNGQTLTHQNVVFKKLGSCDVVSYEVSLGAFRNAQLNAHLVQAGTWVELHLSTSPKASLAEQHALLDQVVQAIQISEKR